MVRTLAVLSLGYDTRFQMRTISHLAGRVDKVLFVRPQASDRRADSAESELLRFTKEIVGIEAEVIKVDVEKPEEAIPLIYARIFKERPQRVIGDLSGGMRALIIETLAALINAERFTDVELVVWLENLTTKIHIETTVFNLPQLDSVSLSILEVLSGGVPKTLSQIHKEIKDAGRTTVYKKLKIMAKNNLITEEKSDGRIMFRITQSGIVALGLYRDGASR